MNIILIIILLLLALVVGLGRSSEPGSSSVQSQACAATIDNEQRCGPTLIDERYQIPATGTTVRAVVNVGALPPEYQEGYEITIDATGIATIEVTPLGSQETITTTVDLGIEGLQRLLRQFEDAGFFYLPTEEEIDPSDIPDGDSVSNLQVTLVDGTWDVIGAALSAEGRLVMDESQQILAAALNFDPNGPTED